MAAEAPPSYYDAPPPPTAGMLDDRTARLVETARRLDITLCTVEEMGAVEAYDIVLLCDDSGSMGTQVTDASGRKTTQTRWDELRDTTSIVVQLATALDADGISVQFLGRAGRDNVTSHEGVMDLFRTGPTCSTPLVRRTREILTAHAQRGPSVKPLLLVIATDGTPDEGVSAFYEVLKSRNAQRTAIAILACTDDDNAVGYLNRIDTEVERVDVIDDYQSEMREVLRTGRVTYTRGDHAARLLLGPISDRWDKLDEGQVKARGAGGPVGRAGAGAAPGGASSVPRRNIVVNVLSASGLMAADKNGLSDPYVKVHMVGSKKEQKTHVKDKTLNPVWNERLVVDGPFSAGSSLQFDVYDKDTFGSDQIGTAIISVDTITSGLRTTLNIGGSGPKGAQATGTLDVSFE